MTSRSFDGKVVLLLGEGRGLLSTYIAPPRGHSSQPLEGSRGRGERRKWNGRCGLSERKRVKKYTTVPKSLWIWKPVKPKELGQRLL